MAGDDGRSFTKHVSHLSDAEQTSVSAEQVNDAQTGFVSQNKKQIPLRCCVIFRQARLKLTHRFAFFGELATFRFHVFALLLVGEYPGGTLPPCGTAAPIEASALSLGLATSEQNACLLTLLVFFVGDLGNDSAK